MKIHNLLILFNLYHKNLFNHHSFKWQGLKEYKIFKLMRFNVKNKCLHHQLFILIFLLFRINLVIFYHFPVIQLLRCSDIWFNVVCKYFCFINSSVKICESKSLYVLYVSSHCVIFPSIFWFDISIFRYSNISIFECV